MRDYGSTSFVATRQRGSHIALERKTDSGTIFVVVPNHKEVKLGTMAGIIRQSGLDRALFETSQLRQHNLQHEDHPRCFNR